MQGFKVIQNEYGDRVVVNLERIDAVIYHHNGTATIRIGDLQINVHTSTAENVEKWLGATA